MVRNFTLRSLVTLGRGQPLIIASVVDDTTGVFAFMRLFRP
jgi:hypothetical protein